MHYSCIGFILLALFMPTLQAGTLSYQPSVVAPGYDYLPDDELHTIKVNEQQQQLLVRSWRGKHQYGNIILLAGPGQVPDTPGLISYLRRSLNLDGWASINLTAPMPLPKASFETAAKSITQAGDGQLALGAHQSTPGFTTEEFAAFVEERQQQMQSSLNQISPHSDQYPGKQIILATNQTAAMLITLIGSQQLAAPDLLVVFNPYLAQQQPNSSLINSL